MIIPPTLLAPGLFGLARWLWLAVAALGTLLLVWAMVDAIGDARERRMMADRTEDALAGEQRANTAGNARSAARESASQATTKELETIHEQDPDAAARPASRGSRAVADRLRARSADAPG